jgi:hypothetical protein
MTEHPTAQVVERVFLPVDPQHADGKKLPMMVGSKSPCKKARLCDASAMRSGLFVNVSAQFGVKQTWERSVRI